MQKGIIGKKIGMTQVFDEKGKVIPVTVIEAAPAWSPRRRRWKTTATLPSRLASAI